MQTNERSGRRALVRFAVALCAALQLGSVRAAEATDAPLVGPKRSIVVDKFDTLSTFNAAYGTWDVGGGLAAMLTTAIEQSGRFVVLERANLDRVIGEQQIKQASAVNPTAGPQLGQVTAAQFIVIGSVTEFGAEDKGGTFNVGISGSRGLGGLLGMKKTEGSVALDLRIVDTTTSQVVQTLKVKEPISQTSLSASTNYKAMSLGGDAFNNTPLGEATRHAIDKAVAEIVAVSARQPWQALVVEVDGRKLAINAGSGSRLKAGDQFRVEHVVRKLTDPATGEVLSIQRKPLGTVRITSVEEKVAFGAYQATDPQKPVRGDLVVMPR
jgi:curli biogenesis system outer membrane secretion channel CsgG